MNIVCGSTSHIPSDTANSIQVIKTCHALAKLGHSVHLLLPSQNGIARRSLEPQSVEWSALAEQYGLTEPFTITWLPAHPRWKRNDFAWRAIRFARSLHAEILYTWTAQSAVFGRLFGLPTLLEIHDLPTGRLGPIWVGAFLRMPGKKRLLPITRALLEKLETRYGAIPRGQVAVVPNGVDLEPYQNLPDAQQARLDLHLLSMKTVLCAGHLYAGRGADLFLGLARRFPLACFIWVGGGPEQVEEYRAKAKAGNLYNATFTGFISQRRLPSYLAAADVFLMPYGRSIAGSGGGDSAEICSPMKMFDYLAAGRAILSSDLPVIHEVLNEQNALFAPPDDLEGWAAALGRLLDDRGLRMRLGAQARADAQNYTWLARVERALDHF